MEQRVWSPSGVRNDHVLLLSSSMDCQFVGYEDLMERGDGLYKEASALPLRVGNSEYKEGYKFKYITRSRVYI